MRKVFPLIVVSVLLFSGCQSSTPSENNPPPPITESPTPQTSPQAPNPSPLPTYADVEITSPDLAKAISSPVTIKGKIDGSFFFEGTFPVTLKDANGKVLVQTHATADNEWTQKIAPFHVTLTFAQPETSTGTLILENDNPSGLEENSKKRTFPVIFTSKNP